jgi:L-lactate dehydrogenase complex protein LldG
MSSRDDILNKLRAAHQPFTDVPPIENRRHMVVMKDISPAGLRARFVSEAEKLKCQIIQPIDDSAALETIRDLIGADQKILAWDFEYIPLSGLADMLTQTGIQVAGVTDSHVRVGVTGTDAALAATGSLVLSSGKGKPRSASLLPYVHIAVIRQSQLVVDLETWILQQRESGLDRFRQAANLVVISGPSRTADIAMELVMGAHGPAELHIILLD